MSILFDPGYFAKFKAEQMLNDAIIGANILEGYDQHLSVFDRFYADDIEASIEGCATVTGKAAVRSQVAEFVMSMHAFAEIGALKVSIQAELVRSDTRDETHSLWTLELTAVTGNRCVLKWRSRRRWARGRVVYERHSEVKQFGGPFTIKDLNMPLPVGSDADFIH